MDLLTERDIQELLVDWIDADAPFERCTWLGQVTVETDGKVWWGDDEVFDLHAHLRRLIMSSTVDAICADCGLEHTVEPDARRYPCAICGADDTVTSPLVLVGFA